MEWKMMDNGVQVNITNDNIAFHTIAELKRLNESINCLSTRIDNDMDKKVDKSNSKWQWMLIFGSFTFTLFVLGTVMAIHMPELGG